MSFFNSIIGEPFEEEPERVMPPWFGPPDGVLPASLPDRAVVFKTDTAMLMVDHLNVFPEGVLLTLNLVLREKADFYDMPWEIHRPGRMTADDPEFLRLGVEFSDGSRWSNIPGAQRWGDFETAPEGPILHGQGGGGGGRTWSMQNWLWPLPTPGDLTLHASWPAHGVDEASASLDADRIISAAVRAEVVWPD